MKNTEQEINCVICDKPAARFDGEKAVVYSHSRAHSAELDFRELLNAAMRSEQGILTLRRFYDEDKTLAFIVK